MKRLLAGHFSTKAEGSCCRVTTRIWVSPVMLSPVEALSAPPNAQVVPNIPHSEQRNQPWALIIYPSAPAPLGASGQCVCSDHETRCCACPEYSPSICKSSPATISYVQSFPFTSQAIFIFIIKNKLCSQLPFPMQKPKFS